MASELAGDLSIPPSLARLSPRASSPLGNKERDAVYYRHLSPEDTFRAHKQHVLEQLRKEMETEKDRERLPLELAAAAWAQINSEDKDEAEDGLIDERAAAGSVAKYSDDGDSAEAKRLRLWRRGQRLLEQREAHVRAVKVFERRLEQRHETFAPQLSPGSRKLTSPERRPAHAFPEFANYWKGQLEMTNEAKRKRKQAEEMRELKPRPTVGAETDKWLVTRQERAPHRSATPPWAVGRDLRRQSAGTAPSKPGNRNLQHVNKPLPDFNQNRSRSVDPIPHRYDSLAAIDNPNSQSEPVPDGASPLGLIVPYLRCPARPPAAFQQQKEPENLEVEVISAEDLPMEADPLNLVVVRLGFSDATARTRPVSVGEPITAVSDTVTLPFPAFGLQPPRDKLTVDIIDPSGSSLCQGTVPVQQLLDAENAQSTLFLSTPDGNGAGCVHLRAHKSTGRPAERQPDADPCQHPVATPIPREATFVQSPATSSLQQHLQQLQSAVRLEVEQLQPHLVTRSPPCPERESREPTLLSIPTDTPGFYNPPPRLDLSNIVSAAWQPHLVNVGTEKQSEPSEAEQFPVSDIQTPYSPNMESPVVADQHFPRNNIWPTPGTLPEESQVLPYHEVLPVSESASTAMPDHASEASGNTIENLLDLQSMIDTVLHKEKELKKLQAIHQQEVTKYLLQGIVPQAPPVQPPVSRSVTPSTASTYSDSRSSCSTDSRTVTPDPPPVLEQYVRPYQQRRDSFPPRQNLVLPVGLDVTLPTGRPIFPRREVPYYYDTRAPPPQAPARTFGVESRPKPPQPPQPLSSTTSNHRATSPATRARGATPQPSKKPEPKAQRLSPAARRPNAETPPRAHISSIRSVPEKAAPRSSPASAPRRHPSPQVPAKPTETSRPSTIYRQPQKPANDGPEPWRTTWLKDGREPPQSPTRIPQLLPTGDPPSWDEFCRRTEAYTQRKLENLRKLETQAREEEKQICSFQPAMLPRSLELFAKQQSDSFISKPTPATDLQQPPVETVPATSNPKPNLQARPSSSPIRSPRSVWKPPSPRSTDSTVVHPAQDSYNSSMAPGTPNSRSTGRHPSTTPRRMYDRPRSLLSATGTPSSESVSPRVGESGAPQIVTTMSVTTSISGPSPYLTLLPGATEAQPGSAELSAAPASPTATSASQTTPMSDDEYQRVCGQLLNYVTQLQGFARDTKDFLAVRRAAT
eukprot:TRINITY_DN15766_c0_g1_i1.p1 TRINITY_DN15766_c0_g1~~TRINITY_DN15766_c0_g1_i1.p1  ORF type:complete len:1202 (+),score=136.66 TRINITY_DN15766_c0_g1_i1:42-3647(+)